MTTDYNAIIELGRGRGETATADDIIDALAGHGPVVSPLPRGRWELIITLPAAGLGTAATTAIALASQASLGRPIISLQVMTTAEFDRRIDADEEKPADELTVTQVAGRLGVTQQRVRQMISEGKLPARRIGGRTLVIPAGAVR